MHLSRVCFC